MVFSGSATSLSSVLVCLVWSPVISSSSLVFSMSNIKTKMVEGRSSSSIDRSVRIKTSDVTLKFHEENAEEKSLLEIENTTEDEEITGDHTTHTSTEEREVAEPVNTIPSDRDSLMQNAFT